MAHRFRILSVVHSTILGVEQTMTTTCMFQALDSGGGDAASSYLMRNLISQGTTAALLTRNSKVTASHTFGRCQVLYQGALTLDLVLAQHPDHFVILSGSAATLRGIAWIWMAALDFERVSALKAKDPDLFVKVSVAHMTGNMIGMGLGLGLKKLVDPTCFFLLAPLRFWVAHTMYRKDHDKNSF